MVVAVQASKRIERELGRSGLAELRAHLWAQDCQTCGRSLGEQRPALVVRDFAATANASLHHGECRRPGWEDDPRLVLVGPALVTHVTYTTLAPFEVGTGRMVPMLLVNPGLEQVHLRRVRDAGAGGRWAVSTVEIFRQFGLDAAGPGLAMPDHLAVAGPRGRLVGDELAMIVGPYQWSAPLGREVSDQIRARGGILLAVTTGIHPGEHPDAASVIAAVLVAAAAGQVAVGWVGVDASPTAETVPSNEDLERLVQPVSDGTDIAEVAPYRGPTFDPAAGRFRHHVGHSGQLFYWTLSTPGQGQEHGLIIGPPQSGKTSGLRVVLAEALRTVPSVSLMVADPLDRADVIDPFVSVAAATASSVADTMSMLARAIRIVDFRRTEFVDGARDHPTVLVAIDDAEAVLRDPQGAALAARIVSQGGPLGVGLVVAAGSVDLADYAGDVDLLLGLAATNASSLSPEHFTFLQGLRTSER